MGKERDGEREGGSGGRGAVNTNFNNAINQKILTLIKLTKIKSHNHFDGKANCKENEHFKSSLRHRC